MPRATQSCMASQRRTHQFHWSLLRTSRHQRALVLKHELADGESVSLGSGQQFRGTVKRKRDCRQPLGRGCLRSIRIGCNILGSESAANGKERALLGNCARRIEGSETEPVGMLSLRAGRKHNVAMEEEVIDLDERYRADSGKNDAPRHANLTDRRFDGGGIDRSWFVASQT
jgi:hypothetical protein